MRDAVSDVIVLDHGSTDDTAFVAARAGARVVRSDAASHELARNAYVELARTPWLLVVDADERVVDASRVRALADRAPSDVLGFALERFDWIGDGRWASTRIVRLFRRDDRVRYFASRAHASVAKAIHDHDARVALGDAPLQHLDALLDRPAHAKRANMRERLEAELARPDAPAILRCLLALEHFAMGDDARAESELARALADDARCEPIVSLFRAQQHLARGRFDDAEQSARRALALRDNPRFRGRESAFGVLADALDRRGARDAAVATLERALDETNVASHHVNLAALGVDPRAHFAAARALNPWIGDARTFARSDAPSIFRQQDALLSRVDMRELAQSA